MARGGIRRFSFAVVVFTAWACGPTEVHHVGSADLTAQPKRVDFDLTWVGMPQQQRVTVSNGGSSTASVDVTITAPFTVDATHVEISQGGNSTLTVTYAPAMAGSDVGTLTVGTLKVMLTGVARVEPACHPDECNTASFDTLSRACVYIAKADGTACATTCLSGACQAGKCLGTFDTCADQNACTVDVCSEASGCSHTALSCPAPSNPCRAAACDPVTGCGDVPVADGTSCGASFCTSSTQPICVAGECVNRPRLPGTRCVDTWQRAYKELYGETAFVWQADQQRAMQFGGYDGRYNQDSWQWTELLGWQLASTPQHPSDNFGMLGYDPARQRTVFLGGSEPVQTWEFDGQSWTQLFPAHSPKQVSGGSMVFDSANARLLLIASMECNPCTYKSKLWTFDGIDWTEITPAVTPPALISSAIGYDDARARVVLFGGYIGDWGFPRADLWELDGAQWTQVLPTVGALWPSPRSDSSFAYDDKRGRLVMFGGQRGDADGGEVWTWDGGEWTEDTFTTGPQAVYGPRTFVYDRARDAMVALGTEARDWRTIADWSWDGTHWSTLAPAHPAGRATAALAYDAARDRTVMFGGDSYDRVHKETWLWDGARWSGVDVPGPSFRAETAMAYDPVRKVVVLFGGSPDRHQMFDDTWEWDGNHWTQVLTASSPPGRYGHAMAYDPVHQRTMLFGGYSETLIQPLADLWEYDGSSWKQRNVSNAPPARLSHGLVYDEARQQLVLFGGTQDRWSSSSPSILQDTWTFDGTAWTQQTPAFSPQGRAQFGMTWDPVRQRIWAFGGWPGAYWPGPLTDTVWWDGSNWHTESPLASPPPLAEMNVVYDSARDELVMFGGNSDESGFISDATWLYAPP